MRADEYVENLIFNAAAIFGVDPFGDSSVVIKTPPMKQWKVGRDFNPRDKAWRQLPAAETASGRNPGPRQRREAAVCVVFYV